MPKPSIGVIFRPQSSPEELKRVVQAADEGGIEELWLWEDCFLEGGLTASAAALAWSQNIRIGIGLLPAPLRNPALAAMEIATLSRLFPGRFIAGVGHGVQEWMAQVGSAVDSPVTLLREHTIAIRELLHGRVVNSDGRYVSLRNVQLDWPPIDVPPVLIGGRGPRTLRLAGEISDGVILDSAATPDDIRTATALVAEGRAAGELVGRAQVVVFVTAPNSGVHSSDELHERALELGDAGADSVVFFASGDDPSAEPIIEAIRNHHS